ncbi:MAG: RNA methyltransferase [Chitinophagaceae bacterium]
MTEERRQKINHVLSHRQNDLTVLLENVHDPHNISAVMRTCDAVGVKEIYVLNTTIPRHKKFGSKSSSSALKWLQVKQYTDIGTCFEQIQSKYKHILATHLAHDASSIYESDFASESVALVFGNESIGVSEDVLKKCTGNIVIPQVGMIQSLNISVACAVTLYEAFRQKNMHGHYQKMKLDTQEQDSLMEYWGVERN